MLLIGFAAALRRSELVALQVEDAARVGGGLRLRIVRGKTDQAGQGAETTHQPYYLGLVSVKKLEIPENLRGRLRAGMPAEVIAPLESRSVLSFLISPLEEAWQRSLHEE